MLFVYTCILDADIICRIYASSKYFCRLYFKANLNEIIYMYMQHSYKQFTKGLYNDFCA